MLVTEPMCLEAWAHCPPRKPQRALNATPGIREVSSLGLAALRVYGERLTANPREGCSRVVLGAQPKISR